MTSPAPTPASSNEVPDRPLGKTSELDATLEAIETMDLAGLRAVWAKHFGSPPALRSPSLLRLQLAWRLQARTYGGIDAAMRRKLKSKNGVSKAEIALTAGSVLTREWQGKTYTIEVLEKGFAWDGETYTSLSAIALAITGTRWNGPRFFGLRSCTA